MTHFSFRHAKFTSRGCVSIIHCCVFLGPAFFERFGDKSKYVSLNRYFWPFFHLYVHGIFDQQLCRKTSKSQWKIKVKDFLIELVCACIGSHYRETHATLFSTTPPYSFDTKLAIKQPDDPCHLLIYKVCIVAKNLCCLILNKQTNTS